MRQKSRNLNGRIFCFCVGLWLQGAKPWNRGLFGTHIVFFFVRRKEIKKDFESEVSYPRTNTRNRYLIMSSAPEVRPLRVLLLPVHTSVDKFENALTEKRLDRLEESPTCSPSALERTARILKLTWFEERFRKASFS